MREVIPALAAGMIALFVGAIGMWFIMDTDQATTRTSQGDNEIESRDKAETIDNAGDNRQQDDATLARLRRDLKTAREKADELEDIRKGLETKSDQLEAENEQLQAEITRLESRMAELEILAAGPNHLRIAFGKWAEVKELRETEWKEVGDAINHMNPLMRDHALATREGRELTRDDYKKIEDHNTRIVAQYLKVIGKLPTHSNYNGEFTHPMYLINALAAQLEVAEDPLTEQQLADLAAQGDEYDRRWEQLQEAYDDKTWFLTKLMDEAELKDWFVARMFEVTTPAQEQIARPPELKGYIGLDLYSVGLMLAGSIAPVVHTDQAGVRDALKQHLSGRLGVSSEDFDSADYIFDDWLNALPDQLQPRDANEAQLYRTSEALASGRAQLKALKALETIFASTDEAREQYRTINRIIVPMVVAAE